MELPRFDIASRKADPPTGVTHRDIKMSACFTPFGELSRRLHILLVIHIFQQMGLGCITENVNPRNRDPLRHTISIME